MKASPTITPLIDALLRRFGPNDAGLDAVIDLAVLVAVADGRVDAAEREALGASIAALVGGSRVAPQVVAHLVKASRDRIAAAGAEAHARSVGVALGAHGAGEDGLRLAIAIARASEGLSAVEREALSRVAATAGVTAARQREIEAEEGAAAGESG